MLGKEVIDEKQPDTGSASHSKGKFFQMILMQVVGVGYVDVGGRVLRVSQFQDSGSFTSVAALLVQLGPRECLLPAGDLGPDAARLKQVSKEYVLIYNILHISIVFH